MHFERGKVSRKQVILPQQIEEQQHARCYPDNEQDDY
jgi:hypothetical protein